MTQPNINKNEISRIKTYVEGFDEVMQGGIPEGSVILLAGTSGSMKSSFAFSTMFYNTLLEGKTCLYISLEQSFWSLVNHAVNLDFDMSKINTVIVSDVSRVDEKIREVNSSKKGNLVVVDLGALRREVKDTKIGEQGDWINVIKNLIRKFKTQSKLDIFTLDSLSALYILSRFENPRAELFHIFESFREQKVTSFLISEMPLDKSRYSEYGVEDYLSDGIIYLERTEQYRKVIRSLQVIKMRATNCDLNMYTLEFSNSKFKALYGGQAPLV
ncbi:MAG TPA: hypothetical protein ENN46_02095 [Candidatus Woesearchaeota archaeon]|nr:hypothetical protein [Candidatus Woesearchaeota archaeon]